MNSRRRHARVLIYSHDSFGLGHLRRCRTIAHALVGGRKDLSVLILSGSPIIGSYEFRTRVDFVRIPGIIKLRNGEYSPLSLNMDTSEVLGLRESIIQHTAEVFDPDILIVDKEPLGLRGEMASTLEALHARGCYVVLGLRDVMDDPELLASEWQRKNPVPALQHLYDAIWVYGLPQICEPLAGLGLPADVLEKVCYTGYPRISAPAIGPAVTHVDVENGDYVLVMTGGGGDGDELIDWLLNAYETQPDLPRALIVFGPFMSAQRREGFARRVDRLQRVEAITFDARIEARIAEASAVVAMGGYNTFCEILSFDKPALIVPRTFPRREQLIRASRAQQLGLLEMLDPARAMNPVVMAEALRALASQRSPSRAMLPGLLDGLERIRELVDEVLDVQGHNIAQA
ncbi:MAG: hypothetical protein KDK91_06250 [Gammaproteobacteria bacterium]|nr:hypothetical protein [Gammaproteobacteria bacterium]